MRSHCLPSLFAAAALMLPVSVGAAERVQFFIGPLEPTIYVEDLEQFAATGQVNQRFAPLASRLSPSQLRELQALLNWRFDLSPTLIGELAYASFGERFLRQLGQVIQTDNHLSGFSALRASLILAAADADGLTGINLLRQFPLHTVQINYPRLQRLMQAHQRQLQERDRTVAALRSAVMQDTTALLRSPAFDPQRPGPRIWERRTLTFENPRRLFAPIADLYLPSLPVSQDPIPVVVISPGAAVRRTSFAYLAEHLASHGYGVVVLEHDDDIDRFERFLLGLRHRPGATPWLSRPRDVTAALNALERLAATDPVISRWNLRQVSIIGHSLGGYTALAVAGATLNPAALTAGCSGPESEALDLNLSLLVQCDLLTVPGDLPVSLRDERVSRAIAISPLTSLIFGEAGLAQVQIPVMVVAATDDTLTPALPEQIEPFDWIASPNKHLVLVERGTHFSFISGGSGAVLALPTEPQRSSGRAAQAHLQALSLAFLNRYSDQLQGKGGG